MENRALEEIAQFDISIDYTKRINFAFQQNSIPIIRRLEIQNNTELDWYHVSCRLSAQPAWTESHNVEIAHIPAGTAFSLTDIPIKLEIDYLAKLSERDPFTYTISSVLMRLDGLFAISECRPLE